MTTYVMDGSLGGTAQPPGDQDTRLLLVVGFDGTPPALRALDGAVRMLRGRSGLMEVVYVAQAPGTVGFSASAIVEMRAALDEQQHVLMERASSILDPTGLRWHFQRRDGTVAHELVTAAKELRDSGDPDDRVVLVVGGSAHRVHHYLNSVPTKLLRSDHFGLVVVP